MNDFEKPAQDAEVFVHGLHPRLFDSMVGMALIELRGVARAYPVAGGVLPVLKNVDLTVEAGEFVAIMGPSGSGKSTLMQILGLLDRPSGGSYRLMGREVAGLSDDEQAALRSRTIGFIFQMFNLLSRTSALEQVMLPMVYAGGGDRPERARLLLEGVGLGDRLDHRPNQLSGGQQQRVAIARALANRPRIIFADEPTGNLASAQAEEVLARLKAMNAEGITVIMVTHESDIAAHARRVIRVKDGAIVADERRSPEPSAGFAADEPVSVPPPAGRALAREYGLSALRALAANKGRAALSMLGVMIGVAAVITMLAVGRGAQSAVEARLAALGSNVLMVFAGAPNRGGVRLAAGSASRLTLEDARAVRRASPAIADVYPEAEGDVQIVYGDRNTVSELQGVTPSYEQIRNSTPYAGRFFTAEEDARLANVAVLGNGVARLLFGDDDPVDKTVRINRKAFKVIGVLPARGSGGTDQDELILAPIRTAMRRVLGTIYLHEMAVQAVSSEEIPAVMDDIRAVLRKRHRLPDGREDDFRMRNNAEVQSAMTGTTRTMTLLLGIVASMSLIVGGVGIMNIMLVSVNERTREIGLRKALGARSRAILIQFLLEAVLISTIGGAAGIFIGLAVSWTLSALAGWSAIVAPQSVFLAAGFSAVVGVVFGLWPAKRASELSPIEALRYE